MGGGFDNRMAYVVAPSTSGRNTLPLLLARRLQREFGGIVLRDGIESLNLEEAKLRRGYLEKVGLPSLVSVPPEILDRLRDRPAILVDDILTSGETLNALQEELLRSGIQPAGVAVLGANQEGKPAYAVAANQLAHLLAGAAAVPVAQVLDELHLAHGNAYSNLLRKA